MEVISGDELAARVFAEQGYLVVGALQREEIGTIDKAGSQNASSHPEVLLRIVAESTQAEFQKQRLLVAKLTGKAVGKGAEFPYFYRVEACD